MDPHLLNYLECNYTWHGRTYPNLDCMGLIIYHFKNMLNIELPDFLNYPNNEHRGTDQEYINIYKSWANLFKIIDLSDVQKNDIFGIKNNCPDINHLGLAIDDKFFIHILEGANCNIQRISKWRKRIATVARYRGL